MIDHLLATYLTLSDKMRNGYIVSLGKANRQWEAIFSQVTADIPQIFRSIYTKIAGTPRNLDDQRYMDFTPGYRLIHIEEMREEYQRLFQMLALDDECEAKIQGIIPILADYSSGYICYAKIRDGVERIFHYSPEDGLERIHNSVEAFLETIVAFYEKGVYYLDADGCLDYDFVKEGIIGAQHNPDIGYWL